MFSFVHVVLLVAIIARTQALECYQGVASGYSPVTRQQCPRGAGFCYTITLNYAPKRYGCGFGSCKEKGCEALGDYGMGTICCCASNLCNRN
ncbi:unnamed protein product [Cylicocyclus nassatus]|uniref:Uncharacterized protein n=1 Tax=Cylicocyclus nassatus TaxID=53992 RepID=A0AA36GTV8_CYLNA|nr:unnamed protein product [Cylicocyclus nassatus]